LVGDNDGADIVLVIGGAAEPGPLSSPACAWMVAGKPRPRDIPNMNGLCRNPVARAISGIDRHETIIAAELQAEP